LKTLVDFNMKIAGWAFFKIPRYFPVSRGTWIANRPAILPFIDGKYSLDAETVWIANYPTTFLL
jgi:hypothetical protein